MKQRILNQFIQVWPIKLVLGLLIVFGFIFFLPSSTHAAVRNLTKSIEVTRNGSAVHPNPFAVLNGDFVTVSIDYNISNDSMPTQITDEFYHAPLGALNSATCASPEVISNPSGNGLILFPDAKYVFGVPSGDKTGRIKYRCTITDLMPASYNKLPEPMIGALSAANPGGTPYYAGMSTSEIILNYDPSLPLMGFSTYTLLPDPAGISDNCSKYPPVFWGLYNCYQLENPQSLNKMVSRTRISESGTSYPPSFGYIDKYEIATLLYPKNSIVGDAYSTGNYLNNFAFYGRNLSKSSGSRLGTGYSWGTAGYTINHEAQSSYQDAQKAYYQQRISQLASEATNVDSILLNGGSWNLQGQVFNNLASTVQSNQYPEGKVWRTLTRGTALDSIEYKGVGTLIIETTGNDVVLKRNATILPKDNDKTSFLGIIVTGGGRLIFKGNNKIQAAVFVEDGNIGDGQTVSNISAVGSFAAKEFNFASSSTGIRFFYDYRLDNGWPPGFRYFNMPTAKNSAQ